MAVETYPDQREPENRDALIWRFMEMWKFRDLMAAESLYFCRADLFPKDENEGLPPEEYVQNLLHLNPFDVHDRQNLNDCLGHVAQFRESFYISCWHLFRDETAKMWEDYGKEGVAICSRYRLLKSALDAMGDRAFLGLVQYGAGHLEGYNLFRFITTKRKQYTEDQEVRAMLWITDPLAGGNRHFDNDNRAHSRPLTTPPSDRVPSGYERKVDLHSLVTGIVISPWATSTTVDDVNQLVKGKGYEIPVRPSDLTRYREFLPQSPAEFHN